MFDKMESLKKELKEVIDKYKMLPNKFDGQVILVYGEGGIRHILRGKKPVPIDKKEGK